MKIRNIFLWIAFVLFFSGSFSFAANWQLKDMGVGIYDTAEYDKVLRVVEKRNNNDWSMKELLDRGAFRGHGKVFGAWLVGPPVNTYLNKNGVPEYGYKYRLTDPRGNSLVQGPGGFYMPGFTTVFINAGLPGRWKIDFMLWQRSNEQVTPIGSLEFIIMD